MPKEIKPKSSFGTVSVDHFSPPPGEGTPRTLNIHVSFEDALKLQLGLNHLLMKLNGYNRSTKEGHDACVNLCVFTDVHSITVNEGQLGARKQAKPAVPAPAGDLNALLAKYEAEVNATNLEPLTKITYILHARNFVRWTQGDFVPGAQKDRRR